MLISILLAVLILVLLVIIGSWIIARHLCKPKRKHSFKTPDNFRLPYKRINFLSGNTKIRGWFIPASYSMPLQPVVILCHGWSSNSSRMLSLAKRFHESGISVLLYDVCGHGMSDSDNPVTLLKFAQNMISAIDYLSRDPSVDQTKIGVVGHSMGGSAGILAASIDPRIQVLASCSSFADPHSIVFDNFKQFKIPKLFIWFIVLFIERWLGRSINSIAPKNRIGKLRIPLLLSHGGRDSVVHQNNIEMLYDRSIKKYTNKILAEDLNHTDIILDRMHSKEIIDFFKRHLIPDDNNNHINSIHDYDVFNFNLENESIRN